MPTLAKISGLRKLNLDGTKVTGGGVEMLDSLTALEGLRLEGTPVDDRAVKILSAMKSLKTLNVSRSRLSQDGAAAILKALPKTRIDLPPIAVRKAVAAQGAIRIKAGSTTPFKDSSGNVWQAELGFSGGGRASRDATLAIANTNDPGLYRSEHFGMTYFSCNAPNGGYFAKLHFAGVRQRRL